MSIKVMSWVWENGPGTQAERLVLLAIADFCDDAGNCWPSMARIGEKACMTERGARGVVRRLESEGWLVVAIGGGRGGCSQYRITMGKPEAQTGNVVPGKANREAKTRIAAAKTRNVTAKTRNGGSAEPSRTIKEPSEEEKAREHLVPILGEDLADDWIAHRREKRKPMSERSARMLASEMARMNDPPAAVRRAIANGWQGVFEDKTVTLFPSKRKTHGERYSELSAALDASLAERPFGSGNF